jgi:hypothetical protein
VKGAKRVVSLIPARNCSSSGETVLGMLRIEDVSSVCESIDNSIFVESLMTVKEINLCTEDS